MIAYDRAGVGPVWSCIVRAPHGIRAQDSQTKTLPIQIQGVRRDAFVPI